MSIEASYFQVSDISLGTRDTASRSFYNMHCFKSSEKLSSQELTAMNIANIKHYIGSLRDGPLEIIGGGRGGEGRGFKKIPGNKNCP